jgi:nucleoside-diphosphate-sugar epimerase
VIGVVPPDGAPGSAQAAPLRPGAPVLVTGGAGFIGGYLCARLAARGHPVTVLDLARPAPGAPVARALVGDVRDPSAVGAALAGCEAVFHLAAAHHDYGIDERTYFAVNEGGARVLCAAMDAAGVREACFYSSVAVFGDAPAPHHEEAPTAPAHPYGASKLAGERVFAEWAARGAGRRALVVRPTITFGPGNVANMYALIRQIRSRLFARVGPGTNVKSLSYVENLVDATLFLWDRPGRPAFDVYHWVEKPDWTSRQIVDAIRAALGRGPARFGVPLPLALALAAPFDLLARATGRHFPVSRARVRKLAGDHTQFEADKARAAGFTPAVTLEEGVRRMVAWFVAEGRHVRAVHRLPPAAVAPFAHPSAPAADAAAGAGPTADRPAVASA